LSSSLAALLPRRCTSRVSSTTQGGYRSPPGNWATQLSPPAVLPLRGRGTYPHPGPLRPHPHGECTSFTVGTTWVSNPLRSPDLRPSASAQAQAVAFAPGVLRRFNRFQPYPPRSTAPCLPRAWHHRQPSPLPGGLHCRRPPGRLRTLYAQSSSTLALAVSPRLLARQLVRTSPEALPSRTSLGVLQPKSLLHPQGFAGSGLRPLTKILDCCLPTESGPFPQSQCGG
jgi:hypothetical protein